ncbi:uncharacterized protein LOC111862196 [Cryptotermes secundus]|uniref:uncharacterized protein LOC111862196 n=1 Tax=Cryptotermes secundus TaxID=105785 RepID=UPI000CD7DC27|nr:uncharacterized protein LOC111862196 [Cryptotermes secundus]
MEIGIEIIPYLAAVVAVVLIFIAELHIMVFLRNVIKERCGPLCVAVAVAIAAIYFLHCLMEGYISHTTLHFLIIFFLAVLTEGYISHTTLHFLIIFFLAVLTIKIGSRHTTVLEILLRCVHRITSEIMETSKKIHEDWGIVGVYVFLVILTWLKDVILDILLQTESRQGC